MAKQKKQQITPGAQMVSLSSLFVLPRLNASRLGSIATWGDQKAQNKLAISLSKGYRVEDGLPVAFILTQEQNQELYDEVLNQRELAQQSLASENEASTVQIDADNKVTYTSGDLRETWRETMDWHEGDPVLCVNSAFRRTWTMPLANTLRAKQGKPYIKQLLVQVEPEPTTPDDWARLTSGNLAENTQKGLATVKPSWCAMFESSRERIFLTGGCIEIDFRNALGVGIGQKYFALNQLMNNFEEVEEFINAKIKAGDDNWLQSVSKERARKMVKQGAQLEEIMNYLADPKSGSKDDRVMKKTDIEGLLNLKNPWARAAAKTIRTNNKTHLGPLGVPNIRKVIDAKTAEMLSDLRDEFPDYRWDAWLDGIKANS